MSRRVTSVSLPFSNAKMYAHRPSLRTKSASGTGMGSVLLRTGGAGAGSSYLDIDDYIATTGINPYTRSSSKSDVGGKGLADKIGKKLSSLNIEKKIASELPKKKRIVMSM
jgi:hypothetical protein